MPQEIKTEISFEDLVLENEKNLNDVEAAQITFEDLTKPEEETKVEEKTEEKKEEVSTEVKVETKVEEKKSEQPTFSEEKVNYNSIAKKLLEKGDWKEALIEKDGVDVKLSELEDLDEETFLGIWEEQKKLSKEELEKEYVPVKGVDENKLKLINIIKNGGDLKEIFQNEAQLKRPYEDADLEDTQTQQNILFNQYLRQGLNKEEATKLVVEATKELTLDVKAKYIVTGLQNLYDENLKKLETETKENKIKEQEKIKEYKKNLNTLYKEEGIEDPLIKSLVDAGTKFDKDGSLYIDTVYEKLMEDPKEAKELIFFMLERDKYLAKKGASIKRDTNIENLKKIKILQDTSKQSTKVQETEETEASGFGSIVLE